MTKIRKFIRYMHIVRCFNQDPEIEGLLVGHVYCQPKVDGQNAGMWWDGEKIHYAKRSAEMGEGDDCEHYKEYCAKLPKYEAFFKKYPDYYLYGEFLTKHTISAYDFDAWNKLYIFDVCELTDEGEIKKYLTPNEYIPMLKEFDIEYVPTLAVLKDPTEQEIIDLAETNHFLLSDGTVGEGVVCKRYDFTNHYGRTTWGKYVRPVFKQEFHAVMGGEEKLCIEEKIVNEILTKEFVEKEYAKILAENDGKFTPFMIPKTLGVVEHEFINDEIWAIIKKYKSPTIDFRKLRQYIVAFTKKCRGW